MCPFHALLSWVIVLRQKGLWEPENDLFGKNGSPPSKRQVASCGQSNVRKGWSPIEIQVIGRWGSMSIMRYVQEAIFEPGRTAERVAASVSSGSQANAAGLASTGNETTVEHIVRRLIAESMPSSAALVHNTRTKFVHKPCVR